MSKWVNPFFFLRKRVSGLFNIGDWVKFYVIFFPSNTTVKLIRSVCLGITDFWYNICIM